MQIIYAHATLALLAVTLGLYIFLTRKGTQQHRTLGQIWVIFFNPSFFDSNIHHLPNDRKVNKSKPILMDPYFNSLHYWVFGLFNLEYKETQKNKNKKL